MCKVRLLRVGHRLCCSITCNENKNEDGYIIPTTQIRMSCLHAFCMLLNQHLHPSCTYVCCELTSHTYVGYVDWILVVVLWKLVAVRLCSHQVEAAGNRNIK